jgi:hypothetical protein
MNAIEQLMVEGYQIIGKHTKIRVIATYDDGLIYQVYRKNNVLLYQGSDDKEVREAFLKNEEDW